jgi:hypothetical protein
MKKYVFIAITLVAALLMIIGCQQFVGSNDDPSPSGGTHGRSSTLDQPWDQVGIDHNRIVFYCGIRLKEDHYDKMTVEEGNKLITEVYIPEFMQDSLGLETPEELIKFFDENPLVEPKYERFVENISYFVDSKELSEREATYLNRLADIMFTYGLKYVEMQDSLASYQDDIIAVKWNPEETLCLDISAVAIHSGNFPYPDWPINPGGEASIDALDIGRILDADAAGYQEGRRNGRSWWKSLGWGARASACEAWRQVQETYW